MSNLERSRRAFLSGVSGHSVQCSSSQDDSGLVRVTARGDDFYAWFDIVAWGDTLTITGDMGTFVFRAHGASDMLDFFRRGSDVNLPYWAEKVQAGNVKELDIDTARQSLRDWAHDAFEPDRYDYPDDDYLIPGQIEEDHDAKVADVMRAAEREVFGREILDERDVYEQLKDFTYEGESPGADCYEWSVTRYTDRYVWCCLAVRWAAQQVQLLKQPA